CHRGDRKAIASAMVDAFDEVGVESRAYQTAVGSGARLSRN
ncbi:homoserine kinase, partial [Natronobacterium gregoryi SP2]